MGLRFKLVDIRALLKEVTETIQPLTHARDLGLIERMVYGPGSTF